MMEKNVLDRINEHEKKFSLLAKNLVDGIWVVDIDTLKYVYITPGTEVSRGYERGELINMSIKDVLVPASFDTAMKVLIEELKNYSTNPEASRIIELEVYKKDGTTTWIEVTARFYTENDGTIRLIGVTKDINRRKLFEMDQKEVISQLEEALEEQKRLLKENKILRGLLPICAGCKKIRDKEGKWWPVEEYIASRTEADFTHTICPECKVKYYPDIGKKN